MVSMASASWNDVTNVDLNNILIVILMQPRRCFCEMVLAAVMRCESEMRPLVIRFIKHLHAACHTKRDRVRMTFG